MRRHFIRLWYGVSGTITMLVVVLLLLTAYGGHIDPHDYAWPSILGIAYPVMLAITVVLIIAWLVLRHWWLALISAIALLATWPTLRVTVPLYFGSSIPAEAQTLRVLSYNVYNFGYSDVHTDTATMRYILDQQADIVLLQEASSDYDYEHLPLMQPYMARLNELYPYRSHGYHDVSILSRYPYEVVPDTLMRQTAENNPKSYHVYAKAFDVQLPQGRQLRVISTHLQSIGLTDSDKHTYENITRLDSVTSRAQLSQVRHSIYGKLSGAFQRRTAEARVMRNFIDGCPPNLIVCGDFNDVPASYSYWTVRGDDLRDAYADAAFGPTFTYNRNRLYFRIDHVLYRGALRAVNVRCEHSGTRSHSDHYPLLTTFVWTEP